MNRKEAEDYIYESYLNAEKDWDYNWPDALKRHPELTKDIIEALANRKRALTINVTGSKGKGSVACMIATLLGAKKKVGRMTSPHIVDFNERFCVSGASISDEDFIAKVLEAKSLLENLHQNLKKGECISPIGIQCIIALNYFYDCHVDAQIFEGGKGVQYDDVNNIPHDYAVINPIFLEHTRELGASLSEIASDKSHIITGHEKCIYVASQSQDVMEIIQKRATEKGVKMKRYGVDFYADRIRYQMEGMVFDVYVEGEKIEDIRLPLLGKHQAENCALALALCKDVLENQFDVESLKELLQNIRWDGRMEIIGRNPLAVLDACINEKSALSVVDIMEQMEIKKANIIVGIPDDKDYMGVIRVISRLANRILLSKSTNPHYVFTKKQEENAEKEGFSTSFYEHISLAMEEAKKDHLPIFILGTTSLVADVKRLV